MFHLKQEGCLGEEFLLSQGTSFFSPSVFNLLSEAHHSVEGNLLLKVY